MIVQVPADGTCKIWALVEPLLAPAVKHTNGCYEMSDILKGIEDGFTQLWISYDEPSNTIDAAMTTSIQIYPRRTSIRIGFIGGKNMRRWLKDFVTAAEAFGRSHGATLVEGYFRKGWARVWPGARIHGAWHIKDMA